MSAVLDLWSVPAFKRALLGLLAFPPTVLQALAQQQDLANPSVAKEMQPPGWEASIAVFRTLYDFARSEGAEAVVSDVETLVAKEEEPQLYEHGLKLLPTLLLPRESFDRKQAFRDARETALPQLLRGELTIDLRAVRLATGVEFVPIIAARIQLDEDVPTTDSVRFAIPPENLSALKLEIENLERLYAAMRSGVGVPLLTPDAWLDWPEPPEQPSKLSEHRPPPESSQSNDAEPTGADRVESGDALRPQDSPAPDLEA